MRILHMADAHFGKRFASSRFGAESAQKRRRALSDALRLTVQYCNENAVDAILCAGDLIESGEIRPSDLRALEEILSGLTHAQVYCVSGNHDPLDASSPYNRLKCDRLTILPPGYSRTMLDGTTALHAYSFPEAVQRTNPLEALALDLSAPKNLLMLHCDAISPESDYLPARMAFLKQFDYCALGHVHQPLLLSPGVRYSGSLIGLDRNETGPRGFVAVDLNGKVSDRFVPLGIPTYESLTVELPAGLGDGAVERRVLEALDALPADNLYSVTLTGAHTAGARPDAEAISERLRSNGRQVYLIDQTRPAYDLGVLSQEHRDDLIGQIIASFGSEEALSEKDSLALEYALTALMEGGRRA
jgi:DNA repair exonuclease SbcCD nuclease subunit